MGTPPLPDIASILWYMGAPASKVDANKRLIYHCRKGERRRKEDQDLKIERRSHL
jgi:hypothetical protein